MEKTEIHLHKALKLGLTKHELFEYFLEELKYITDNVDEELAKYLFYLLIHDGNEGLILKDFKVVDATRCQMAEFVKKALKMYINPYEPSTSHIKLLTKFESFYGKKLDFNYMQEHYEKIHHEGNGKLLNEILQYPHTSTPQQYEDIIYKIQLYVILEYRLGDPNDLALMKRTKQAFETIYSKKRLEDEFAIKKDKQRLNFLKKLVSIISGILIFNNEYRTDYKYTAAYAFNEIQEVYAKVKQILKVALRESKELARIGKSCSRHAVITVARLRILHCLWPMERIRIVRKYLVFFTEYNRCIQRMADKLEDSLYAMELDKKRFVCVCAKITENIRFRPLIEREYIFVHYSYLSDIWRNLLIHLRHFNNYLKIKDDMDKYLNKRIIEDEYVRNVKLIKEEIAMQKHQVIDYQFRDLLVEKRSIPKAFDLMKVQNVLHKYGTLTMALTNGLLVPAKLERKLLKDSEMRFGFVKIAGAKYSERYAGDFIRMLRYTIYNNMDLILLARLIDYVMMEYTKDNGRKFRSIGVTANKCVEKGGVQHAGECVGNKPYESKKLDAVTYKWDFLQETIRLANIRQRQTHSTQSVLTYAKRNAQNQTYNARVHKKL